MGSEQNAAQQGEQGQDASAEPLTEERINAIIEARIKSVVGNTVNAAMTNHLKRFKPEEQASQIQKQIDEAIAKVLTQGQSQPGNATAPDAAKPSPEMIRMQEQFEKLERKYAESEARGKEIEEKARLDNMFASTKSALADKGIVGIKADALIAHFQRTNMLRFNEDGSPRMFVKRSRTKNSPAEELDWDITQGVDDWSKGPEAAEFLPPPTPPGQRQGSYGSMSNGSRRGAPHYEKPAGSLEEAARRAQENLIHQGVDIGEAFRR
jgi:hypothetical protein